MILWQLIRAFRLKVDVVKGGAEALSSRRTSRLGGPNTRGRGGEDLGWRASGILSTTALPPEHFAAMYLGGDMEEKGRNRSLGSKLIILGMR